MEQRDAKRGTARFFRAVFVDRDLEDDPRVARLLGGVEPGRVRWVDGRGEVDRMIAASAGSDPRRAAKRILHVTRHRGEFLKSCPGSPGQVCCGYHVLNLVADCPFDCTYCILQSYLDVGPVTLFANVEDALGELRTKAAARPDRLLRVGTGELGDSLALEPLLPVSRLLLPVVAGLDNVLLELKTKSACVDALLDRDHGGRVMVSWSLGPEEIVRTEERGAAPLRERLRAARRVEAAGYLLGFHFDPIILRDGWEDDYRRLLDALFRAVDPRRVVWISLGCLRFPAALREAALERFARTRIYLGEFVPCPDGKMRYLRPVREETYGKVAEWIRERAPGVEVYLCMESALVWRNVFGVAPAGDGWLSDRLDRAARRALSEKGRAGRTVEPGLPPPDGATGRDRSPAGAGGRVPPVGPGIPPADP
jgi:spore photoproduct lyase